ncbi:hypothetical protein DFH06DRAFT_1143868 [Mycena polygramma]|nr:hypothetical protein DFH06DRAFT_1143868 [Mycena polygramma]
MSTVDSSEEFNHGESHILGRFRDGESEKQGPSDRRLKSSNREKRIDERIQTHNALAQSSSSACVEGEVGADSKQNIAAESAELTEFREGKNAGHNYYWSRPQFSEQPRAEDEHITDYCRERMALDERHKRVGNQLKKDIAASASARPTFPESAMRYKKSGGVSKPMIPTRRRLQFTTRRRSKPIRVGSAENTRLDHGVRARDFKHLGRRHSRMFQRRMETDKQESGGLEIFRSSDWLLLRIVVSNEEVIGGDSAGYFSRGEKGYENQPRSFKEGRRKPSGAVCGGGK